MPKQWLEPVGQCKAIDLLRKTKQNIPAGIDAGCTQQAGIAVWLRGLDRCKI